MPMTADANTAPPLVAVVTPVYNGAEFLAETMASVQAQTYPNIVHVVLDNASTDATPHIIERFNGGKVPLVIRRNPALLGMDDNWNEALKFIPAEAKYFTVVCADDALWPDSTAKLTALAESDPEITIVSSEIRRNGEREDALWPKGRVIFDGLEAARLYLTGGGTIEGRQMLMPVRVIAPDEAFFDERVVQASDMDVFLRLLNRGKFGFVHEPLMDIRDHEASEYSQFTRPLHLQFCSWLINMDRHARPAFDENEFRDLRGRYWRCYLRRMLQWRAQGNTRAFERHLQELAKLGQKPGALDFAAALAEWPLVKAGLRRSWTTFPAA